MPVTVKSPDFRQLYRSTKAIWRIMHFALVTIQSQRVVSPPSPTYSRDKTIYGYQCELMYAFSAMQLRGLLAIDP